MNRKIVAGGCAFLLVAIVGCGGASKESGGETEVQTEPVKRATAYLTGRSGGDLGGSAIFINGPKIDLQVTLEQAPPGEHAVHIHEIGDCSADDGSSAGGHWNPTGHDHGRWDETPFHLGDIGNVVVNEEGDGSLSLSTDRWTMGGGGTNDIMGLAVVVHAVADDFTSQPSGAAGARIGCGVINPR